MPASAMGAGVSKSGSPAPRLMMSLPSALSLAASAATARVGEGLTRCARREVVNGTEVPRRCESWGRFRGRQAFPPLGSRAHSCDEACGYIKRFCPRGPCGRAYRGPMSKSTDRFELHADYVPAGDQPEAIERLVDGLTSGLSHQTLLGVTGSGKTDRKSVV